MAKNAGPVAVDYGLKLSATIDQAQDIKNTQIAKELSLPPIKLHCSMLAEDAIKAAIKDYKINIRFFTFAVCKVFYYSVHPTSAFSARGALTTRFVTLKLLNHKLLM